MTERPDGGYRTVARIEVRSGRTRRVLATLAAVALVGWVGASTLAFVNRLQGPEPTEVLADVARSPTASQVATGPTATRPPTVEVLTTTQVPPIPVRLGGLAFLIPDQGALFGQLPLKWGQWLFAHPDGSVLCVCLQSSGDGHGDVLTVRDFGPEGPIGTATSLAPWADRQAADGLAMDAVANASGNFVAAATAVADADGWTVSIARIGRQRTLDLRPAVIGRVSNAEVGTGLRLNVRVWLTPDARTARVRVSASASGPSTAALPENTWTWLVDLTSDRVRVTATLRDPFPEIDGTRCPAEAFASNEVFIRVCREPLLDGGGEEIVVRRELLDGEHDVTKVDSRMAPEGIGWVVDGRAGMVYGWEALAHRLFQFNASTGALATRSIHLPPFVTDFGAPEGPQPPPRSKPAIWQPVVSGANVFAGPLVGSPDGSLLYAAGEAAQNDPVIAAGGLTSTGIWIFDAATMQVVDHWSAVASYDAIGLSPDGRWLLATGNPGPGDVATFGNQGPTLAIHATTAGGAVQVILHRIATGLGAVPSFLTPSFLTPGGS